MMKIKFALVTTVLLAFSACASASTSFNLKKPKLTADTVEFDYKSGVGHYYGNVKIWDDTTTLTGEKMTVSTDPTNPKEIKVVTLYGKPARYHSQTADKNINASALEIIYNAKLKSLTLSQQGEIQYDHYTIKGPKLIYNIEKQRLVSTSTPKQRTILQINETKMTNLRDKL